jgi:hypothetical protein
MDLEGKSIIRQKSFMEECFATKMDKTPLFNDQFPQKNSATFVTLFYK